MVIIARFEGTSDAARALPLIPGRVQTGTVSRVALIVFDEALRGAQRHNRTGALVRSLFSRQIDANTSEVGHDTRMAPQAIFVNFGTRAHIIKPKNAKALRWSSGGVARFAKLVKHPGYRGDPYLFDAAPTAIEQMQAIVDDAFAEATA